MLSINNSQNHLHRRSIDINTSVASFVLEHYCYEISDMNRTYVSDLSQKCKTSQIPDKMHVRMTYYEKHSAYADRWIYNILSSIRICMKVERVILKVCKTSGGKFIDYTTTHYAKQRCHCMLERRFDGLWNNIVSFCLESLYIFNPTVNIDRGPHFVYITCSSNSRLLNNSGPNCN